MRKLKTIWFVIVLAITVSASAQISITQGSLAPIGASWVTYTLMDGADFSIGSAGANQTWTFGEYAFDGEGVGEVVNPDGTPYAGDFPNSNWALASDNSSFSYFRVTSNALFWLGMASAEVANVFDEEAYLMPFPCTYNSAWTTVTHTTAQIGPLIIENIDSLINSVDGWGTLQTQFGSYSVIRVFSHIYMRTQTNMTPPSETEYLSYVWYTSNGLDVASVTSDDGVTDPNFTTGFLEMSTTAEAAEPIPGPVAKDFRVSQNYPNPFNPSTTLPLELTKPVHVTLSIYDETGRLTSQEELDLPAGQHQLPINGSKWGTGMYFAHVTAGADEQTVKMLLMK